MRARMHVMIHKHVLNHLAPCQINHKCLAMCLAHVPLKRIFYLTSSLPGEAINADKGCVANELQNAAMSAMLSSFGVASRPSKAAFKSLCERHMPTAQEHL